MDKRINFNAQGAEYFYTMEANDDLFKIMQCETAVPQMATWSRIYKRVYSHRNKRLHRSLGLYR